MPATPRVRVPPELAAAQLRYRGAAGQQWVAGLPALAASFLRRWDLRLDGPTRTGVAALVLPVRRADGTPVVLKLQAVDEETVGEPAALRAWAGHGAARLLAHDRATGTMLLERLDATRPLSSLPDPEQAVRVLAQLLARLGSVPAPAGLRRLDDLTGRLLRKATTVLPRLADPDERGLLHRCAAITAGLLPVREHRLLHWDLHYDNVLAGNREPWLAIDPKPLVGETGFELLPALQNRWAEIAAGGDPATAVRTRFDLLTDLLALERSRAAGWTLARVLQNVVWDLGAGALSVDPVQATIARALLDRASPGPG